MHQSFFRLLRRLSVLLLLSLVVPNLSAQVRASLVSENESIEPGRTFHVALRLVHDEHWHTYWKNPGTGLPTTIAWKLPEGWRAGEILWPTPSLIKDATDTASGYGYDGDTLLLVPLTAPSTIKAGDPVILRADVSWLMCRESCVPGKASLELRLTGAHEKAQPDAEWGPKIASTLTHLPKTYAAWALIARTDGKNVALEIRPNPQALNKMPTRIQFYSEDGFISLEGPQTISVDEHRNIHMTLPISGEFGAAPATLTGVLSSETGWIPGEGRSGIEINTPLFKAMASNEPPPSASQPPGKPAVPAGAGLAGTLLLAMTGGLILNLMPCVFPVLGIKILGFVQQAGSERRKVVLHGLVFTAGVLLSFWSLAGLLALLRAGGTQLGWGFQLQSAGFVYLLAMLMLAFALNMSGLFEFGLGATGLGSGLQMKEGYAGSFFTGVLATVVATPCSAPFLAPALGAALALPPVSSFAVFTAIGVGLSTPYLLLSCFPSAVRLLPRPGAWMEGFRQLMAFPLYGTVGYLLWVLAGQVEENALLAAFLGSVLVAMGAWLYGRWNAPGAKPGRARAGLVLGLVLAGSGLWAGWPPSEKGTDAPAWEHWSPARVEELRKEGRLVYVDFTARWCATCQANKRLVFGSAEVRKALTSRKTVFLKGDWTNRDPAITEELARWNRSAVPFNLIYLPGQEQPVILPELLTADTVLKALK